MIKLNPKVYMLPVDVGSVIYQKTSDEIQMSLDGEITAINEHEEPWVIMDINKDTMNLYNLETGRKYKMYLREFYYLVRHDRIRISEEVA